MNLRQNRALHEWFQQLAEALSEKGQDMRGLQISVPIRPTADTVEEMLWRPVMESAYPDVKSAIELKSGDIDVVVSSINQMLNEQLEVFLPFSILHEIEMLGVRRALHLWFIQLAKALADKGEDMRGLKIQVPIRPSKDTVKEMMWRPMMEATYPGVQSTAELKSTDIDPIVDAINQGLGEQLGVYVPFPSLHELSLLGDRNVRGSS